MYGLYQNWVYPKAPCYPESDPLKVIAAKWAEKGKCTRDFGGYRERAATRDINTSAIGWQYLESFPKYFGKVKEAITRKEEEEEKETKKKCLPASC